MIFKLYGGCCDGCTRNYENEDFAGMALLPNADYLRDEMTTAGWVIREDGRVFCPECIKKGRNKEK